MTIDRIDSDGNYGPSNCRWVSVQAQHRNQSSNRLLTFKGKTMIMKEWAEETGIKYDVIRDRINKLKWSTERALTTT